MAPTLLLMVALLMTWGIALPVGCFQLSKNTPLRIIWLPDRRFWVLRPSFLLALVLMYVAAVVLRAERRGLFSEEYLTAPWSVDKVLDLLAHLWVPVVILAVSARQPDPGDARQHARRAATSPT